MTHEEKNSVDLVGYWSKIESFYIIKIKRYQHFLDGVGIGLVIYGYIINNPYVMFVSYILLVPDIENIKKEYLIKKEEKIIN